jgi:hypothetical protein
LFTLHENTTFVNIENVVWVEPTLYDYPVSRTMQLRFEELNETDIREEVIAPLLRRLGYVSGTSNNVIREQLLRYPKQSLGRKNLKRDPQLRGKADYVLEVDRRLRWVIEAKPPNCPLSLDDIEQAWTYASHAEVRAIYFVVCNGRNLIVHRTTNGPDAGPLLSLKYEDFDSEFTRLESVLSPTALLRDFSDIMPDLGTAIAPGLRSVARITNGVVSFRTNTLGSPIFEELQMNIRDGAIERDERGVMIAFIKSLVPSRSWQALNERLGLSNFEMRANDSVLSLDSHKPTVFSYKGTVNLAEGEEVFDLSTWKQVRLPTNVVLDITTEATGTYLDRVFSGIFATNYSGMGSNIQLSGNFEIYLS